MITKVIDVSNGVGVVEKARNGVGSKNGRAPWADVAEKHKMKPETIGVEVRAYWHGGGRGSWADRETIRVSGKEPVNYDEVILAGESMSGRKVRVTARIGKGGQYHEGNGSDAPVHYVRMANGTHRPQAESDAGPRWTITDNGNGVVRISPVDAETARGEYAKRYGHEMRPPMTMVGEKGPEHWPGTVAVEAMVGKPPEKVSESRVPKNPDNGFDTYNGSDPLLPI